MTAPVQLLSISTASPPNNLTQDEVQQAARQIFITRFPQFARMASVFHHAGVRNRQMAMPVDWYLQPHGWAGRTAAFDEVALDLFCRAAEAALEEAGLGGPDVDAIVS